MTPYMFVLHKNVISFYVQKRRMKALGSPGLAMFILSLSGLVPRGERRGGRETNTS